MMRLTQHGKAFQQQCPGRRWYPQSGAPWFLTTWHSIPARTCAEVGNCQRSKQAWLQLHTRSAQGTFSASCSSPRRESWCGTILTFAATHLLQGRFVSEGVFAGLDDKCEASRDRLCGLRRFGFFGRGHRKCRS
jgi:hypothetical protein